MAKREYSLATEKLIDRICRLVERKDFVLDKEKGEELVLKTYDLFNLPRPQKVVRVIDMFDKYFENAAWSAGSAWSAWSAQSAALDVEYDNVLYLVPDRICRIDEQNRFHSEIGPAIWWKGEKEFYFWHGVSVSEKIIMHPEKLTKKDWMDEKNIEVRRCIQEKLGDRFVKLMKGKKIHKDKWGTLYEIDLKDDPDKVALYVHVKDSSTKREYYLRCDTRLRPMLPDGSFGEPQTMTAHNAVASTYGLRGEDYKPVQQT